MSQLQFFMYLFLAVLASGVVGLAWGEYRGYRAAQKDFHGIQEMLVARLKIGDKVLTALDRGDKVSVITGPGQSITNFWIGNAKELKKEDWEALEETTKSFKQKNNTEPEKE